MVWVSSNQQAEVGISLVGSSQQLRHRLILVGAGEAPLESAGSAAALGHGLSLLPTEDVFQGNLGFALKS